MNLRSVELWKKRFDFLLKGFVFQYGFTDTLHSFLVKGDVVEGVEAHYKNFISDEQMSQIGTRIIFTGIAITFRI